MWCKTCNRETYSKKCEVCGNNTEEEIPLEIFWCENCKTPIIKSLTNAEKNKCPVCNLQTRYMCVDLRIVFPEERLLIEILLDQPFKFKESSVWASNGRYYIDGNPLPISFSKYLNSDSSLIIDKLIKYREINKGTYESFSKFADKFINANYERLAYLKDEAYRFILNTTENFSTENVVVSFSGGKDSTVVADLVVRALSNPSIIHIYGDTTLELELTHEYVRRFRRANPKLILKTAKNKDQNFYKVCEDIGPPARLIRWCCSMFKTGPITRILTNLYRNKKILTFYGIRKCESVSRSKYNRVEDSAETIKIAKQTVASPIFSWKDIDIWLYILSEKLDFNDAYKLGFERVGCWCCPNNNDRSQFLSKIYIPEEYKKWRTFLIDFAIKLGKPDPEVYIDTGKWKARQGGNGVASAEDVKIKYTNCTAEDNARIYQLFKPVMDDFYSLFTPFGTVSKELGRKLINEVLVLDLKTNVPILSIQPFNQPGIEYTVKIKTMNVEKHDELQRMVGYQVRKYNACRKCLKCEAVCKSGAIMISAEHYKINPQKCTRCRMCVTAKYLEGGCLMTAYLVTKKQKVEAK